MKVFQKPLLVCNRMIYVKILAIMLKQISQKISFPENCYYKIAFYQQTKKKISSHFTSTIVDKALKPIETMAVASNDPYYAQKPILKTGYNIFLFLHLYIYLLISIRGQPRLQRIYMTSAFTSMPYPGFKPGLSTWHMRLLPTTKQSVLFSLNGNLRKIKRH